GHCRIDSASASNIGARGVTPSSRAYVFFKVSDRAKVLSSSPDHQSCSRGKLGSPRKQGGTLGNESHIVPRSSCSKSSSAFYSLAFCRANWKQSTPKSCTSFKNCGDCMKSATTYTCFYRHPRSVYVDGRGQPSLWPRWPPARLEQPLLALEQPPPELEQLAPARAPPLFPLKWSPSPPRPPPSLRGRHPSSHELCHFNELSIKRGNLGFELGFLLFLHLAELGLVMQEGRILVLKRVVDVLQFLDRRPRGITGILGQ
ncbi:Unknown protein, partial [Striga hermonthica]